MNLVTLSFLCRYIYCCRWWCWTYLSILWSNLYRRHAYAVVFQQWTA